MNKYEKMIKGFISKTGNGKSLSLLIEAAAQENKKVAFISLEMDEQTILKRLESLKSKTKEFNIYTPNSFSNLDSWICKKLEKLSDEVDLICIDAVDNADNLTFEKLHSVCFGNFMNQCNELWVSLHIKKNLTENSCLVSEKHISNEIFKVKQISRKIENNLLPGVKFIEAVDLENNEVKTYNLSNIFKSN